MTRSRRPNPKRTPTTRRTSTPARRASEGAIGGESPPRIESETDSPLPSRRAGAAAIETAKTALHYTNRRGEPYYLQEGKTPTGKPKYYAGKKLTGKPLTALPEGHEFYVRPDTAQVIIRKIPHSVITELERRQAEDGVRRASGLEHSIGVFWAQCTTGSTCPSTARSRSSSKNTRSTSTRTASTT